ncbi:MAG: putative toxin-antitoxin system toxin component, PIN family [Solirubrobacterales bacterium]|nr:putative toxin-antitoxin system toxin component, PIN family [Solirubrobacterales bacterium]
MTPRPRVACDTNVLVSAFIAGGPPSRVIEQAVDGNLDLVLLQPVSVELVRILSKKLGFTVESLQEVRALLSDTAIGSQQAPSQEPEPLTGDPDDDLILSCAIEAEVDVLVSGDRKHLLPVGEHQGVRVLTPQAFLAELRT